MLAHIISKHCRACVLHQYQVLTVCIPFQHLALCRFPSEEFYNGQLQTDERICVERERQAGELGRFWPGGKLKPLMFCNVIGEEKEVHSGWKEKAKVGQESKFNEKEARQIVSAIKTA